MFGLRRRHRKAPARLTAPVPDAAVRVSGEELFERVHAKLEEFMGTSGTWALVRRDESTAHDDRIFASMSTISLARDITTVIVGEADSPDAAHAASDESPAVAVPPALPREKTDTAQIAIELTTIAQWADPKRHDPDVVDPDLVSPAQRTDAQERIA